MPPESDESGAPPPSREPAPVRRPLLLLGRLWWLTIAIVALDQATKTAIQSFLPLHAAHPIVPGVFELIHVQNAGVAFGLLNDFEHPYRTLLTLGLAVAALLGIGYYARQLQPGERLARVGLSLILGGAVGNLIDRVRHGFVIDFVDVSWRGWHFWAFNVADAAITVGAGFVLLELLRGNRHASDSV